ncbi:MAG: GNAT family N-acetyltransferase [Bauldia sp.]|uniref:GNAT family N-acetyltransferase n=1 Tax=Bauldia sp. TaxID=2575872 RepID=UPI001D21E8E7|nr:GNAT family N-acetyltransferase [Bauldia sp.]MCB1495263.1 GNAT family N-acetyltransferase [Bauldia sp.]
MNILARTAIVPSLTTPDIATAVSRIAEISVVTDPRAIEDEWRRFETSAIGHVFQTFDFVRPWLQKIGADEIAPRIVVGRELRGDIVFLLPFGIRRCLGATLLEWLGGPYADYHAGLFAPHLLASLAGDKALRLALVEAAMAPLRAEVDVVHFRHQPETLGDYPNPFAAWHPSHHRRRAHWTRLAPDWDTYYRSKRNSSSRRHDRLKWEKMADLGPVAIIDAERPADSRRILAALFEQKDRTLAAGGVPPFFASRKVRAFYEAMALKPYPAGPAHVSAIECDGRIVATNWGLVRGNRYYYVMTSYEGGAVSRYSPGRALMRHLMRWSIERGISEFDFTVGDEDFKSHWCEENEYLRGSLRVFHPRGALLGAALAGVRSTKQLVTTSPQLTRLANQLRCRLAAKRG